MRTLNREVGTLDNVTALFYHFFLNVEPKLKKNVLFFSDVDRKYFYLIFTHFTVLK